MHLDTYLGDDKGATRRLAEALGVSTVAVWRWRNNKARPSWPMMDAIAKATSGKVTAADFPMQEPPRVVPLVPAAEAAA